MGIRESVAGCTRTRHAYHPSTADSASTMAPDLVHEQVVIGSLSDVRESSTSSYDRVISVCQECAHANVGIQYDHFNLADGPLSQDVMGGSLEYEDFKRAADHLHDCLKNGEHVFIHCHAGVSRSPSVTIAALGRLQDKAYEDVLNELSDNRPKINPQEDMKTHSQRYIAEALEKVPQNNW